MESTSSYARAAEEIVALREQVGQWRERATRAEADVALRDEAIRGLKAEVGRLKGLEHVAVEAMHP